MQVFLFVADAFFQQSFNDYSYILLTYYLTKGRPLSKNFRNVCYSKSESKLFYFPRCVCKPYSNSTNTSITINNITLKTRTIARERPTVIENNN